MKKQKKIPKHLKVIENFVRISINSTGKKPTLNKNVLIFPKGFFIINIKLTKKEMECLKEGVHYEKQT